jgi:hypothetical protein
LPSACCGVSFGAERHPSAIDANAIAASHKLCRVPNSLHFP